MKFFFSLGVVVLFLTASGPGSAAPLNISAICNGQGFESHEENRIYRGSVDIGMELETALVITPVKGENDIIEVFFLLGTLGKLKRYPSCVKFQATENEQGLTIAGDEGSITYEFSDDEATLEWEMGGEVVWGTLTLSDK